MIADGTPADDLAALREAAVAEVAAGLAEAEEAPLPDPATLLDGVYATRAAHRLALSRPCPASWSTT